MADLTTSHATINHAGVTGVPSTTAPNPTTIELGHASDTTLARIAAGRVSIEGNEIYKVGGTDVAVADGGTGASSASAGFNALSPMTTSGDIIYGGASGAGTRLAKGSDGQVLTLASGLPSWAAAGGGSVTVSENYLGSDVTMTTANTFYDGPSLTLSAGSYILIGHVSVLILNASGAYITAKLWDGTTVYDDSVHYGTQFARHTCNVTAYVTPSGSTTYKISATQNSSGGTIETTIGTNGAANKGSHLIAIKIA